MHWADFVAQTLSKKGDRQVIASGITPSGEFHIGHLREILTGDMITRACKNAGMDVEFVFIVDSADPLRKVYSFLSPEYEQYIGCPLATIPAPDQNGKPSNSGLTYAEHFLNPFLKALEQIDVRPRIIDNYCSYNEGNFSGRTRIACAKADEIREIIERVSGRELADDWFPYNPFGHDGSLDDVTVTGFEWPHVYWQQKGKPGQSDIRLAEGKLPWRVDWPARWGWIGITCEPFGKDHGAAGGSYSTGKEISQLFGDEPPHPLVYEWISLKGQGAMSSSSGNTIGPLEALELVPPEILRYLIASTKPKKAIEFDAGMSLVELADEYERLVARDLVTEAANPELSRRQKVAIEDAKGALAMSSIGQNIRCPVSFRHLAMLAQVKTDHEILEMIGGEMEGRLARMRNWIDGPHFPNELKIEVLQYPMEGLNIEIKKSLVNSLSRCDWIEDDISKGITAAFKENDIGMKEGYQTLYLAILGVEKGPRLAPILAELAREHVIHLLG
ncbi:MAG TPA: lysine--tRNA ligase [Candidatus Poseidoniales archaeon]|jgi:lysyl-tRNA synthetase class 1|nr:MAG: lysine--tRNA ligase [Euryarchaeota archaeon]HIF46637.1 lysine--tRNA ligase [Candidatus Poseidoniales archaeon]